MTPLSNTLGKYNFHHSDISYKQCSLVLLNVLRVWRTGDYAESRYTWDSGHYTDLRAEFRKPWSIRPWNNTMVSCKKKKNYILKEKWVDGWSYGRSLGVHVKLTLGSSANVFLATRWRLILILSSALFSISLLRSTTYTLWPVWAATCNDDNNIEYFT